MTDKERFLMKLLFEYNWKDAFSDVKISDKAEVYYPNRNWFNFAKLQNDNIYSERTISQIALANWQNSEGARMELQYAKDKKKLIIYEDESTRED